MLRWLYANCPICGNQYPYLRNKPSTCSNYDCVHKFIQNSKGGDVEAELKEYWSHRQLKSLLSRVEQVKVNQ